MIRVISDRQEIEKLHKRFHRKLDNYFKDKIDCLVGYPGGSFDDTVRYSPDLDLWISVREPATKYWNGFGIGRPDKGANNSLNGEINFPYGIDRRIAGAFAIEDNGNILVLHRGKIGGGKPGVGKKLFTDNFRGDFVTAIDDNRETEFCLVGELNSRHLPRQIANFILEIKRIKDLEGTETTTFNKLNNFQFTNEHTGQSDVERVGTTTVDRTHGIVVTALANALQTKGFNVANDRNRDLFIYESNYIKALFEIKTSSATQNLYAAVGQLIIYSIPIRNEVDLVVVLPNKLNKTVERRLKQLGIRSLYYKWDDDVPVFIELSKFLLR